MGKGLAPSFFPAHEHGRQDPVIQKVTEYLAEILNFTLSPPRNFILFAPATSAVSEILASTGELPYPVSFISYEVMLEIYKGLVLRIVKPETPSFNQGIIQVPP